MRSRNRCPTPQQRFVFWHAERTFWEKATILHMWHHAPEHKKIPPRMSRHYYDVFRLAQSPIWQRAMAATGLLDRVAVHKSVFFKAAWAHYDTARPGTLRLTPSDHIVDELKQDYLRHAADVLQHAPFVSGNTVQPSRVGGTDQPCGRVITASLCPASRHVPLLLCVVLRSLPTNLPTVQSLW